MTMDNLKKIEILLGKWEGFGIAEYPTIKTEDYREELIFSKNNEFPVLHYEQRTWIKNVNGDFDKPVFWETGFLRALDEENQFELCNAQKSGRIEVLSGKLLYIEVVNFIVFSSKAFSNDEKLVNTSRKLSFSPQNLNYELFMSIKSHKNLDRHLKASLKKVKPE
jgi:hypothetical protein